MLSAPQRDWRPKSRPCCATRTAWLPWGMRRGRWGPPTPRPGWPSWSMHMPDDRTEDLDLRARQRVHIVGIGGAGMSAIALVRRAMGHTVSGSDLKESPVAARLRAQGITVAVGHRAENVGQVDAITYSPAVAPTNVEIVTAAERGARVVPRSGVLAAICATRRCLAVAGTKGKTTTASMLSLILIEAGLRPSF